MLTFGTILITVRSQFFELEEVNRVKKGKKHYVTSGADTGSEFVFEVKNNPQKHCGKPKSIYP